MIEDSRTIIDSFLISPLLIFTGLINAAIPRIKRIFAIHDPMIFPREIPASFSKPAPTEMVSSGAEVPNPIITTEIMKTGIPYLRAVFELPSVRISDPLTSKKIPIMKRGIAAISGNILSR